MGNEHKYQTYSKYILLINLKQAYNLVCHKTSCKNGANRNIIITIIFIHLHKTCNFQW